MQSVLLSRELDGFRKRVVDRIHIDPQIQPLIPIIEKLQSDPNCSRRVVVYLNDVKDHVEQLLNDIQYCSNRSNNVYNLIQSIRQKKQEHILFLLTIITAIFTPITFLAGVYGMNFDNMPVITLNSINDSHSIFVSGIFSFGYMLL